VDIRFGQWLPLAQAASSAPRGAGVYQVKIAAGLVEYPTGRSAMIHYGAAADVAGAVAELAAAHPGRAWMCRFAEGLDPRSADVDGMLQELMIRFRRRFGAPPSLPR
jgi:hypothetical protein